MNEAFEWVVTNCRANWIHGITQIFSGLILLFPDLNPLDLMIWEQVKTLMYSMGELATHTKSEKVTKFA